MRACEIGAEEGLRYVYAGNLPAKSVRGENTRCPGCSETLIERFGYLIRDYHVTADGSCPHCNTRLPGIWPGASDPVRTGNDMNAYRLRLPRPVTALPPKETTAMPRELTDEQKQRLLTTTGELVRSLATGQPFTFAEGALAGLGEMPLAGVFVSLKRGKHTFLLRHARRVDSTAPHCRAAMRTVSEDGDFAGIAERGQLSQHGFGCCKPALVNERGEEHERVTIGKHGIKSARPSAGFVSAERRHRS